MFLDFTVIYGRGGGNFSWLFGGSKFSSLKEKNKAFYGEQADEVTAVYWGKSRCLRSNTAFQGARGPLPTEFNPAHRELSLRGELSQPGRGKFRVGLLPARAHGREIRVGLFGRWSKC